MEIRIGMGATHDLGIQFGLIQVSSIYVSLEKALLYFYSETKCNEIQHTALINNSPEATLRVYKEDVSGNILIQNNVSMTIVVDVVVII